MTLQVPTGQTGFAAPVDDTEPVTPGDTFTYLSRTYHVVPPIQKDRFGKTYTLRCVERKRLSSGVA